MKKKNKLHLFKHQLLITGIAAVALVISVIGSSYAIFTSSVSSGEYNVLQVGDLEISYVDPGSGYGDVLSLNGAYPITDNEGKASTPYRFYIKNTGGIAVDFKLKLKNDESIVAADNCGNNLLDFDYVRVQFDSTGTVYTLSDLVSSDYTLYEKTNLAVNSSEIHEVRIWIDEHAPNSVLGKHFHGKLVVELIQAGVDSRYTKSFSAGDSVKLVDNSNWHVLTASETTDTVVTLISDKTLNSNGGYCSGTCDTIAFNSECTTCNVYNDATIKTLLDTYTQNLKTSITNASGTLEDLTVSIPTMEQIAKAAGVQFNQNVVQIPSGYLTSSSYWTKTAYSENGTSVWYINGNSNQNDLKNATSTSGVRPVITVSKLDIATE